MMEQMPACEIGAGRIQRILGIVRGLLPAVVLFSAFFGPADGYRWIGLFGFIPLALYLSGCPTCGGRGAPSSATWPGH